MKKIFNGNDNIPQKQLSRSISNKYINNLSNEVVIAASGQVKLEQLDSCLNLCHRDFIVFDC